MPKEIDMIANLILDLAVLQQDVDELRKLIKAIQNEIGCLPSFEFKPKRE